MIFVDSNVPMYLIGIPHPHKNDAQQIVERLVANQSQLVTSVEVLQEILHRYWSICQPAAIQLALDAILNIVDTVLPIDMHDIEEARNILLARWTLKARDAVHAAVMKRHGIKQILSFDADFDQIPDIVRIHT